MVAKSTPFAAGSAVTPGQLVAKLLETAKSGVCGTVKVQVFFVGLPDALAAGVRQAFTGADTRSS